MRSCACAVDDDGSLRIDATPASSAFRLRVFGARPVATSSLSARNSRARWSGARIHPAWATWLACVVPHLDAPGAESGCHGLADGRVFPEEQVLRARIVTWLPSRAKACASSTATTDGTDHGQAWEWCCSSASVEVQWGLFQGPGSAEPPDWRRWRPGSGRTLPRARPLVQTDGQVGRP